MEPQREASFSDADFDVFFTAVSLALENGETLPDDLRQALQGLMTQLQSSEEAWEMTADEFTLLLSSVGVLHSGLADALVSSEPTEEERAEMMQLHEQVEETFGKLRSLEPGLLQ